jgi:predicted adenylyl cyclase CyaB
MSRRNIELKARLSSLDAGREIAQQIATKRLPPLRQTDTYFHCQHGRLKLRELDSGQAQLVWYARPDNPRARASDYLLAAVGDAAVLKQALAAALGIRAVVEKRREVYLYHNVRIHLDEVAGLGTFLEFEAVLGPGLDDDSGLAQLDFLSRRFDISPADLLAVSYADLLAEPGAGQA